MLKKNLLPNPETYPQGILHFTVQSFCSWDLSTLFSQSDVDWSGIIFDTSVPSFSLAGWIGCNKKAGPWHSPQINLMWSELGKSIRLDKVLEKSSPYHPDQELYLTSCLKSPPCIILTKNCDAKEGPASRVRSFIAVMLPYHGLTSLYKHHCM